MPDKRIYECPPSAKNGPRYHVEVFIDGVRHQKEFRLTADGWRKALAWEGPVAPGETVAQIETLLDRALRASEHAPERARRFAERTAQGKHGKKKKKQPRSKAVTGWVLAQAVDADGNPRCERCLNTHWQGEPIFRQGHHVLDFGTYPERDDIWNVIALCGNCHDCSHQGPNAEAFNAVNAEILKHNRPERT